MKLDFDALPKMPKAIREGRDEYVHNTIKVAQGQVAEEEWVWGHHIARDEYPNDEVVSRLHKDYDFELSKALSVLLRHSARELGYQIHSGARVAVEDVLALQSTACGA